MPTVRIICPEGGSLPTGPYEFDVAPVVGSVILFNEKGDQRAYQVTDVFHGSDGDRIAYYAAVEPTDKPPTWLKAEDYRVFEDDERSEQG